MFQIYAIDITQLAFVVNKLQQDYLMQPASSF